MYLQLMVYYNTRSIKILIAKKDPLKFSLFFNSYWCYKLSLDQQHLYKEITNIILIIINKSISFQPLQNLSNGKKIKKVKAVIFQNWLNVDYYDSHVNDEKLVDSTNKCDTY